MADIILRQFNETLSKWISYLNNYTIEMLHRQPQRGSWSLGQVYIHIIDDTGYYIGQMKSALLTNAHGEKDMHENAKVMFRNNGFPDQLLQGPSTGVDLKQPAGKDELLQSLLAIREEVNNLNASYDLTLAKGKAEHPGFHFLTALEWLQLAEMHMRHHFRQKKRIDDKLFIL